ncbi:MAG: glutaminyl-peptide cyclotransferase, partial [Anaerolineaceae bacterium]
MAGILLLFVFILVNTGCSGIQPLVPASLTTATDPAPDSTRTTSPQAAADTTPSITDQTAPAVDETPEILSFRVVKSYPHDSGAFTEGLVIHEGILYETTGLNGRSTLRQVDLETGRVLRMRSLGKEYFGEGLAVIDDRMVWATWRTNTAFVYDLQTFEVTDEFNYEHEGWGMAYNGTHLYLSDGTDIIHILSPLDYSEVGTLRVSDHGEPVDMINELEFIDGDLYANIWLTTKIAR